MAENLGHYCPPEKHKFVLIASILASAMGFIDLSVVAVALPQMRGSLGASFAGAQWISNSYMLFLSALILLGGALGDRLGVKRVFSYGIGGFCIASLACALAPTTASIIGFRALQGAAAAVMIPGSMALIALNTPRKERGRAMGIWASASSIATAAGPFLGGFVLSYGGEDAWRWIFAFNLPIALFTLWILKEVPTDARQNEQGLASIDWMGALLFTGALGLLATGLTFLQQSSGLLLLGAGLMVGAMAIAWELSMKRAGRVPMVDLALFRSRVFSGGNVLTFLIWAGMGGSFFFLATLVIVAWKLPPTFAGSMFIPFSVMVAILAPVAGNMMDKFGARGLLTLGATLCGLAFLAIAWSIVHQEYWLGLLPSVALMGCGVGLIASPLSAAILNSVEDKNSGVASGINNMVARGAGLFAVAGLGAFASYVYGVIIRGSDLHRDVAELMVEAGFGERLSGGLYQIATVELQAVAMNHAVIAVFLVMAAMAFVAALVGWFTQEGKAAS